MINIFLATRTASVSFSTNTSTTPFGIWTSKPPISVGLNTPNPPNSIIAGPPIPIFDPFVAMITSQHPNNAAFPAKQ